MSSDGWIASSTPNYCSSHFIHFISLFVHCLAQFPVLALSIVPQKDLKHILIPYISGYNTQNNSFQDIIPPPPPCNVAGLVGLRGGGGSLVSGLTRCIDLIRCIYFIPSRRPVLSRLWQRIAGVQESWLLGSSRPRTQCSPPDLSLWILPRQRRTNI